MASHTLGSRLVRGATIAKVLSRLIPLGHHDGPVEVARQRQDLGLGWLYYSLVRVLKPANVVVVGSLRGFSVVCMALALEDNDHGHIDFIDAATVDRFWTDKKAVQEHFGAFGVTERITVHPMTTAQFLRTRGRRKSPVDFLFLDGDHRRAAVRFDHRGLGVLLAPRAYVAFHDSFVGGFGFTEWEVADYLSGLDLTHYEVLTFAIGQGLTLLKRLPTVTTHQRHLARQQKLRQLARAYLGAGSSDSPQNKKARGMAVLALRVATDAGSTERASAIRLRFLRKSNSDLRRELRRLRHRAPR